jgi:hypothetical protein
MWYMVDMNLLIHIWNVQKKYKWKLFPLRIVIRYFSIFQNPNHKILGTRNKISSQYATKNFNNKFSFIVYHYLTSEVSSWYMVDMNLLIHIWNVQKKYKWKLFPLRIVIRYFSIFVCVKKQNYYQYFTQKKVGVNTRFITLRTLNSCTNTPFITSRTL